MAALEESIMGVHATKSHLWMQVRRGQPLMKCQEGLLRPIEFPGQGAKVMLGDVASILLRISGPHDSVRFIEEPVFDEQRWKLEIIEPELNITVSSRPYWGFGLFARCYLNEVIMLGNLERRARLVYDLVAALGRNPWEASFGWAWTRSTGDRISTHLGAWESLISYARNSMSEEIAQVEQRIADVKLRAANVELHPHGWDVEIAADSLDSAVRDIGIAKQALHEANAAGLRRALDRVETLLISADPLIDIKHGVLLDNEEDVLKMDDVPFVDFTSEE